MIVGGIGGANTTTGAVFEKSTNLQTALNNAGYILPDSVFFNQNKFLKEMERRLGFKVVGNLWSKGMKPDECLILGNHIYIIEKKYQQCEGSVDEKPQTVAFKKWQYDKLATALNMEISYCYLFNDWFKKEKYQDMLDFIEYSGCRYFFNEIPIEYFVELNM